MPAATAGLIYMVASIWDGLIDPLIGVAADRTRTRWGGYRPYLLFGTVPLALAFGLLYYRPPLEGTALVAVVLVAHLLFRSLYALVNVPYAALTARITRSAAERATIAGARMVFAHLRRGDRRAGDAADRQVVTGSPRRRAGFFVAACLFALLATLVLLLVFATDARGARRAPEPATAATPMRPYWRQHARATAPSGRWCSAGRS